MSKNYSTIPGKITVDDSIELAKLAKGRNVVQLGAYCGRATVPLALAAKHLWVLDDFSCAGAADILEELKQNVKEAGVDDKISFLFGTGQQCTSYGNDPTEITMVYRDADRSEDYEYYDQQFVLNILKKLNGGGIYAWHGENGFKHMIFRGIHTSFVEEEALTV